MSEDNHDLDQRLFEQSDELIAQMRSNLETGEQAPSVGKSLWGSKEIRTRPRRWIIRTLMVIFLLVVVVEARLVFQNVEQNRLAAFEGGPAMDVISAPREFLTPSPSSEEFSPPPPENETLSVNAPEPTAIPLPEGVEDVPFPTPES